MMCLMSGCTQQKYFSVSHLIEEHDGKDYLTQLSGFAVINMVKSK